MSIFVKKINDILSGNLDKIGKNVNLDESFILNQNNYLLLSESNKIKNIELLKTDTPPTGLLYNIKNIGSYDENDTRNYFYSCLNLILNENEINALTDIEECLFANAFDFSTSKLANLNEYILDSFIIQHNSTSFETINDIKESQLSVINSYLSIMKAICEDDRALYRFIPNIINLRKAIC